MPRAVTRDAFDTLQSVGLGYVVDQRMGIFQKKSPDTMGPASAVLGVFGVRPDQYRQAYFRPLNKFTAAFLQNV